MSERYEVGGPYPIVTICRRVPEQDDLEVGHIGLEPLCELTVRHLVTETQADAQHIVDELNCIATLEAELAQARADQTRLQSWVNDLQSGMYINCVYCGHRYGPDPGTPVAMADVLKKHIEYCPQHPMSALRAENERLTRKLETETLCHEEAAKMLDEERVERKGLETTNEQGRKRVEEELARIGKIEKDDESWAGMHREYRRGLYFALKAMR